MRFSSIGAVLISNGGLSSILPSVVEIHAALVEFEVAPS